MAFQQGEHNSFYYAEEILTTNEYPRTIRSNDRATQLNLMKGLKAAYTSAAFLPDDKAVKVWYAMLKDLPLDALSLAVQKHIATEKFPPTIAELRAHCADIICADLDEWTEAWSKVLDVVSGYGLSNGQEGLKKLDPATREAVKRVGYWTICNSENISIERANFRTAYEQIVAREKQNAVIPQRLAIQIEQRRQNLIEEKSK